jgi:predicted NUDIX family NTP pyrophosphohydrolase
MYRLRPEGLQVFIAKPGGPWFPHRDHDTWTIPKGEVEPGEERLTAAIREFREEVGIVAHPPYLELGSIRQKGGKTVYAWAFQGDWDESKPISTLQIEIEWPPGSGKRSRWPEISEAGFHSMAEARLRLKTAQHALLDRLMELVGDNPLWHHP